MKRRLLKLIILVFSFWLMVRLAGSTYEMWKRRDILTERQKELAQIEADNKKLKRELEQTQDPNFIEQEARNMLGLVKPSEIIVLLTTPIPTIALDSANMPKSADNTSVEPAWKQWWQLFF